MAEGQANYFLKEVSEDLLLNEPGMQPLRQQHPAESTGRLQKFLEKRPGDPRARQQMAEAKRQLGELYVQVGRSRRGPVARGPGRGVVRGVAAGGAGGPEVAVRAGACPHMRWPTCRCNRGTRGGEEGG